jgi:hypothetical protein
MHGHVDHVHRINCNLKPRGRWGKRESRIECLITSRAIDIERVCAIEFSERSSIHWQGSISRNFNTAAAWQIIETPCMFFASQESQKIKCMHLYVCRLAFGDYVHVHRGRIKLKR